MKFEKSCGAVLFRDTDKGTEYLAVLSKAHGHWGFPKGHVEQGETERETAEREVLEETGLAVSFQEGFRTSVEYSPAQGVHKEVVFFLGKLVEDSVSIQQEEIEDYRWADYQDMLELLDFQTDRGVLEQAAAFLSEGQNSM